MLARLLAESAQGWRSCRIDATGMNPRLLANDSPGWTAKELVDELTARPARVVGVDVPFSVPHALLRDSKSAADIGSDGGAVLGGRAFNRWIAQRPPLVDLLDFAPFAPWRDRAARARPARSFMARLSIGAISARARQASSLTPPGWATV